MSYSSLEGMLAHPSPAFVCGDGCNAKSTDRFVARIEHKVNPCARTSDLELLNTIYPAAPSDLVTFYRKHDGCVLFDDPISKFSTGLVVFPINRLKKESGCFRTAYRAVLGDYHDTPAERRRGDTLCYRSAFAIAVCAASSNYFVVPTEGQYAGRVCLFLSEGWPGIEWSGTFNEFYDLISRDPVSLFNETLGGITRYEDGKTNRQWYPVEYIPDSRCDPPTAGAGAGTVNA